MLKTFDEYNSTNVAGVNTAQMVKPFDRTSNNTNNKSILKSKMIPHIQTCWVVPYYGGAPYHVGA
jgi:hypothetical protein